MRLSAGLLAVVWSAVWTVPLICGKTSKCAPKHTLYFDTHFGLLWFAGATYLYKWRGRLKKCNYDIDEIPWQRGLYWDWLRFPLLPSKIPDKVKVFEHEPLVWNAYQIWFENISGMLSCLNFKELGILRLNCWPLYILLNGRAFGKNNFSTNIKRSLFFIVNTVTLLNSPGCSYTADSKISGDSCVLTGRAA